jgi:hypothetical protein
MKKASLFASAAVAALLAGASAPVFAQGTGGPFADVPVDHWAYKAVDTLQKDGIVIGYPDGTYGGKRAMTRYEFAVAIARLLDKVNSKPVDLSNYVTKDDLNNALTPYAKLSDLAGLAKQSDLDALRKLVNEFQTELTTLGVDLDATKKRLDALEGRVAAIEQELKRVQVGGSTSIMGRANNRSGSRTIMDQDGAQVTGNGSGSLLHDSRVLHSVDVSVKARLSDTATAETVINYGNYLPFLGSIGSYSFQDSNIAGPHAAGVPVVGRSNQYTVVPGGVKPSQVVSQAEQFTVYKAVIEAPIKLPGVGGTDLMVGRLPIQFTPYTLKLIDTDAYFNNPETDLGDIPVDGGKIRFNLGPVTATGFAAKVDPIQYLSDESGTAFTSTHPFGYGLYAGAAHGAYGLNGSKGGLNSSLASHQVLDYSNGTSTPIRRPFGSSINPYVNGAMQIEQMAGVRASYGLAKLGTIGATYLVAAGQNVAGTIALDVPGSAGNNANFNRVFVYGADINTNIAGFGVVGSYTKSDTEGDRDNGNGTISTGSHSKITKDNEAIDGAATYAKKNFTATAGYKYIGPYFAAPGSWDKVGAYTNPVDIKGAYVRGQYNFSNALGLELGGKFYQGTGKAVNDGGLLTSDKITNLKAGLKYGLTSASNVDAGIERTEYKIGQTGLKPVEYFYNIGYGYSFTPAASFKLLYQIVDYRDKGSNFDTFDGKGGVAATQFTVKF